MYIFINIWNNTNGDFMYYINSFFIYSILGHIIEGIFYAIGSGESGILYGWWTPIYGVGCIFLLYFYDHVIKPCNYSKGVENVVIFFSGAIFLTLFEFIAGNLVEYFFDTVFWNYENLMFNIGKYISLEVALIWGFASLGLIRIFRRLFDFIEEKIPKWITWVLIILFIIDSFATFYFKVL